MSAGAPSFNPKWRLGHKVLLVLLGFFAAALATYGTTSVGWLANIEFSLLHSRSLSFSPLSEADAVTLVVIDDNVRSTFGIQEDVQLRPRYAELIRYASQAPAKGILIDLEFALDGPRDDREILQALNSSKIPIVLTAPHVTRDDSDALTDHVFVPPVFMDRVTNSKVRIGQMMPFLISGSLSGIQMEKTDYAGKAWTHADRLVADAVGAISPSEELPVDFWTRLAAPEAETPTLRLDQILERAKQGDFTPMTGRILVLGSITNDVHQGPRGRISGPEHNALAVRSLLQRHTAINHLPPSRWWPYCLIFALSGAVATQLARSAYRYTAAIGLACAAVGLPVLLGATKVILLPTLAPLIALAVSAAGSFSISILQSPKRTRTDATTVFIDLVGFTPLTVALGEAGIGDLMAQFHRQVGGVFERAGAHIERMHGDAILLMFPGPTAEARVRATLEACAMARLEVKRLEARLNSDITLDVTLGIEDGPISGVQIETLRHEEWSSFGASVNMAARLQAVCGQRKLPIVMGPAAASAAISAGYRVSQFDALELKGFEGKTPVFTVDFENLK